MCGSCRSDIWCLLFGRCVSIYVMIIVCVFIIVGLDLGGGVGI